MLRLIASPHDDDVLCHALEACPLNTYDINALDHALFSSLLKYFAQNPNKLLISVRYCSCPSVVTVVNQHEVKFLAEYVKSEIV